MNLQIVGLREANNFILLKEYSYLFKKFTQETYKKNAFHKFQEKNLNLNRDSSSDLQISTLVRCHWAILVLIPIHLQTVPLKCHFYNAVCSMTLAAIYEIYEM